MRQKRCWNYFAFNQSYLAKGKIAPAVLLKYLNDFTLADQDWIGLMIFKNFGDRTGSDSIFSDQDRTRTEKFHSPLISA